MEKQENISMKTKEGDYMELQFKKLEAAVLPALTPLFQIRRNKTCDSVFPGVFLWKDFYHVRYALDENHNIFWRLTEDGKEYAALPSCREEDLPQCFDTLKRYFNEILNQKLAVFLADEAALEVLNLSPDEFLVEELDDAKDYLYDADSLKNLSGRKLHKKKNLVNSFLRSYEGRFEYRRLKCQDEAAIWNFLVRWRDSRGSRVEEQLAHEVEGIHEILRSCSLLDVTMGGIFIDGTLEAFSIGSFNPLEKMAVIHIEKANPEIRGLYQFINQQFLVHEFPDAILVNREDDMGDEGLRQAKMSYCPSGFARKFRIRQR